MILIFSLVTITSKCTLYYKDNFFTKLVGLALHIDMFVGNGTVSNGKSNFGRIDLLKLEDWEFLLGDLKDYNTYKAS